MVLGDILYDEENDPVEEANQNIIREQFSEFLDNLPMRDRKIVEYRFGLRNKPKLFREAIQQKLGITEDEMRQIEQRVFKSIRDWASSRRVSELLTP